jgi:Uma2 family endonuclease
MVAERIAGSEVEPESQGEPQAIRWTTEQFHGMAEAGVFEGRRVSLIEGEILEERFGADVGPQPQPFRWTTEEFQCLNDPELLAGRRIFLVEGEIFEMMTMDSPHATSLLLATDVLREVFGAGYVARAQMPLRLSDNSNPEPDLAIVSGRARDYARQHPTSALLVVEVSDTTLRYDQTKKAGLYARAGIAEYWIVNLHERRLEVHRSPIEKAGQAFGWAYEDVQFLDANARVAPLEAPDFSIAVVDLLP